MASKKPVTTAALRDFALGFPGATEEFPWGDRVVKVAKKIFVFLGRDDAAGGVGIGVKLPASGADVLELPFAEPTGYGLGKSGWVTIKFPPGGSPPLDVVCQWIEESYGAVAPKKLLAERKASAPRAR